MNFEVTWMHPLMLDNLTYNSKRAWNCISSSKRPRETDAEGGFSAIRNAACGR